MDTNDVVLERVSGEFTASHFQQDTQTLYLANVSSGLSIFSINESPYKESTTKIETSAPVVSFVPYASNSVYFLGTLANGEVIVINS